ncbi:zinc finger CCHC domain-containing protein 2 isoform X3 [Aquarana catesbeiana]|uniref:zinc finger CCHC domain-containing protein 2 isoform X3 n=1 Tax=Aquarana catesbeiana TaxID=8400 RepID=UPI003CC9B5C1
MLRRHGSSCGTRGKGTSVLEVACGPSPHTPSSSQSARTGRSPGPWQRLYGPETSHAARLDGPRMLKMKLPPRKSSAYKASDEEEDEEEEERGMYSRPSGPLQRESVYEWFVQSLGPAQRLEFACGLLDLCNPLELRFLGSCLEDLARKDCHYLRDCESRANGLAGEPELGDLSDRTARSRLIVYLALLSSENREVAGRLYRLLLLPAMGMERLLGGWEDGERKPAEIAASREELLLLFTMASLHPAFSFHQRVTLRERLDQLREAMSRKSRLEGNVQEYLPNHERNVVDGSIGTYNGVNTTPRILQQEAVHIENISLKYAQRRRAEKNSEYTFEVTWSDNSKTSVTKSYRELVEFLLTLPKELSNEHIDKTIIDALHLGKRREEHSDLEPIIQQIFSSPSQALLRNQRVCKFFHNNRTETGHPSHVLAGSKFCKTSEDSSETSSQEEDGMHHTTGYKKSGKSLVTNYVPVKSSSGDAVHISHPEQNGTDWRKNDCRDPQHPLRYINDRYQQRTLEKCSSRLVRRENTERSNQKVDGRSTCRANGIKSSQNIRVASVKDPTLEVGSGHETCGETSSESYSSPPSPRHNRRESFESEEEKDRDTDSNSEDSSKHVHGFPTFASVNTSSAKLSDHLTSNESIDSLNSRTFTQFQTLLPTLHCMMPTNVEKMEPGHPLPTEGKTLGMIVSPVSMPPVRELIHQSSLGIGVATVASAIGEPGKCIDILTPPMPVPSTFLPRNCSPSSPALQMSVQRLKVPTQGSVEACTVNGSTQTNMGLGTANAGFISIHNHGGFTASPVTASEPLSKPISQVASLNQVVPHLDGNMGIASPAANVKLVLSGTNLTPAPSTIPYPLSGPSLPSGVLPTPNTNVLNAAAPAAAQPTNNCIGQVQSAVPLTVPTHSPGPAPSPSPALTHSTAQSDSTSFISAAVGNTSTNGTLLSPQQMSTGTCGSCGRRCGCGVPMGNYYYPNPVPGQMFTRVPFPFPMPSICNSTYLNQAHQSNGTHYPVFLHQPPYTNGLMHEPVLGGQANYGMQQMAGFARLYPIYPATNVVGNANGSVAKKNGNISCFNCGVAGHYAQDCKQPSMEANQQGTFRLRYAPLLNPSHDSLDSAD